MYLRVSTNRKIIYCPVCQTYTGYKSDVDNYVKCGHCKTVFLDYRCNFHRKEKKQRIMYVLMSEKEYKERDKKADILQLKKVKSSSIVAIGYQQDFLYVVFNTNVLYKYTNVPLQVVADLFNEKVSIGELFYKTVKKGGYKYEIVS